jgi:hypothetical protein
MPSTLPERRRAWIQQRRPDSILEPGLLSSTRFAAASDVTFTTSDAEHVRRVRDGLVPTGAQRR